MIATSDILKGSILIVDDQEANVLLLDQMLRGAGYLSVASTRYSEEVCDLHRRHKFDLILLDLQMPGMDGFQVMEGLREIETGGNLPVLVITAQPDHKLRALRAGAKDFVSKPFDLTEVLVRVHNLLEVRLLHLNEMVLSYARLENSQRIAGLGDWEYDFGVKRLFWSDGIYRLLGLSRKTTAPDADIFYAHVHPDDLAFVRQQKQSASEDLCALDFEHRLIRSDGQLRYIHQITEVIFDDQGRPIRESGIMQDITERRLSEIAILESNERHRKMLMLSPDAHFVQVDGLITFANQAYCQLMGATKPEQLMGRAALELFHPDSHGVIQERRQQHAEDIAIAPAEMKFLRLDGTTVDVEVTSVAFDFRGHNEVQVIARNISARKLAAAALRLSEERFKFAARAVSDVVWDWDLSANTLWWNDGFWTTFGFLPGEIEPSIESWTARIHPHERSRVREGLHRAIDSAAEAWRAEYRFQRKNGSYAFVQDRAYIIRNAAGTGGRMIGGIRDLTEQRQMESQYLRSQRMDSIGTLAGGIAHDLNNVFAPIMMSIELLRDDASADPQRCKVLDTIYTSTRRGADLVRQVLSFARGVEGQRVPVRMRDLVNELAGIIRETFPRNLRISTYVTEDLWTVIGDSTQLHQVLLNLAVNARDAMPDGGALTVRAENSAVDPDGLEPGAITGKQVLLQVIDTGQGIPPEVRERIFEPFFTTKELGKGTGLGLATVHTIVKSHGGFVQVESEIGQGTTFKIYLPADNAHLTSEAVPVAPTERARGRDELILLVDDERPIREVTRLTLEAYGYRVLTAADGAEAVGIYAQKVSEIALVITDMMMPIMDGGAAIQVLRRINPAVRIIAASGLGSAGNFAKATSSGVHDFLAKPYTAHTLLQLVREVLDRPAPPATLEG